MLIVIQELRFEGAKTRDGLGARPLWYEAGTGDFGSVLVIMGVNWQSRS